MPTSLHSKRPEPTSRSIQPFQRDWRGVADCGQDLLVTSVLARIGTTGVTAAQISECRTKIAAVQSSAVGSTDPISVDVVAAHLSDPTLPWVPAEVGC